MTGVSDDRALWLSQNVLPHEPALRVWLTHRRTVGLDVDDIVQETYAKLAALDSVANIRQPKSYIFQTAYSVIITHIRRSRVISIRAIDEIDLLSLSSDEPSPERQLDDREQLQLLAQAIASLPEGCRRVFVLRRVEGFSQRAVAERLGLSENTVEHHMTKSVHLLMDIFGRGGKPGPRSSIPKESKRPYRNDRETNKRRD